MKMRNYYVGMVLALFVAFGSVSSPAFAREPIVPFIVSEHYKENISLSHFNEGGRELFRSESAFDLIVDYVEDEIGRPLSDSQFLALMRDSTQTRVRDCATSEEIRTGALQGNQFYWFSRNCRSGEQIVQVFAHGRWIDMFSLGCLNAVEDKTPIPPPVVYVTPPPPPPAPPVGITFTQTMSNSPMPDHGRAIGVGFFGGSVSGGININTTSSSSAASAAAASASAAASSSD